MAFKGRKPTDVDFTNLNVSLVNSKLQQSNFPLYQTIKGLIDNSQQSRKQITDLLNSFFGDIIINDDTDLSAILAALLQILDTLKFSTFWTENDETVRLPESNQVIAGTGITLDYSVAGRVTISATGGSGSGYYAPLTDGNIDETDLIYAAGECIMVAQP